MYKLLVAIEDIVRLPVRRPVGQETLPQILQDGLPLHAAKCCQDSTHAALWLAQRGHHTPVHRDLHSGENQSRKHYSFRSNKLQKYCFHHNFALQFAPGPWHDTLED